MVTNTSTLSFTRSRPAHKRSSKPPRPFRRFPPGRCRLGTSPASIGSATAAKTDRLDLFPRRNQRQAVELIKEAIPSLSRLAVLVNPANPTIELIVLTSVQRTASALGVELVRIEVKGRDDITVAMTAVAKERAPALLVIEEPLTISNAAHIADLASRNGVPMIGFRPQAEAGALLEYGADLVHLFSRAAAFVDKILKGTSPADLPIERAVKFDLIVNLKSAKALGIELPPSLLIRADEVIE
jgi:putative tryptophan/tyrosine transport system substrate-binding protein